MRPLSHGFQSSSVNTAPSANCSSAGSLELTPDNQRITNDLILIFVRPALLASQKARIFGVGRVKWKRQPDKRGGRASFISRHPSHFHDSQSRAGVPPALRARQRELNDRSSAGSEGETTAL